MELRKNNYFLYNSVLIKKFIRELAKKGKVQKISKAFFLCLQALKFKFYLNTFTIFLFLLNEIKPYVILKTLRLGSVSYQVPVPLPLRKQYFKALKLLVGAIRGSNFKGSLNCKIFKEFILILKGSSSIIKLNSSLYKNASSARSFLHYRWD